MVPLRPLPLPFPKLPTSLPPPQGVTFVPGSLVATTSSAGLHEIFAIDSQNNYVWHAYEKLAPYEVNDFMGFRLTSWAKDSKGQFWTLITPDDSTSFLPDQSQWIIPSYKGWVQPAPGAKGSQPWFAATTNASGQLQLFAVGEDGQIHYLTQGTGGDPTSWASSWQLMPTQPPYATGLSACHFDGPNGVVVVTMYLAGGQLYYDFQTPNGWNGCQLIICADFTPNFTYNGWGPSTLLPVSSVSLAAYSGGIEALAYLPNDPDSTYFYIGSLASNTPNSGFEFAGFNYFGIGPFPASPWNTPPGPQALVLLTAPVQASNANPMPLLDFFVVSASAPGGEGELSFCQFDLVATVGGGKATGNSWVNFGCVIQSPVLNQLVSPNVLAVGPVYAPLPDTQVAYVVSPEGKQIYQVVFTFTNQPLATTTSNPNSSQLPNPIAALPPVVEQILDSAQGGFGTVIQLAVAVPVNTNALPDLFGLASSGQSGPNADQVIIWYVPGGLGTPVSD